MLSDGSSALRSNEKAFQRFNRPEPELRAFIGV